MRGSEAVLALGLALASGCSGPANPEPARTGPAAPSALAPAAPGAVGPAAARLSRTRPAVQPKDAIDDPFSPFFDGPDGGGQRPQEATEL